MYILGTYTYFKGIHFRYVYLTDIHFRYIYSYSRCIHLWYKFGIQRTWRKLSSLPKLTSVPPSKCAPNALPTYDMEVVPWSWSTTTWSNRCMHFFSRTLFQKNTECSPAVCICWSRPNFGTYYSFWRHKYGPDRGFTYTRMQMQICQAIQTRKLCI